jgi:carboxypeptidase Taq
MYSAIRRRAPGLKRRIAAGDFAPARTWLQENIYAKGRLHPASHLIQQATGKRLKTEYLERHIAGRYLGLRGGG